MQITNVSHLLARRLLKGLVGALFGIIMAVQGAVGQTITITALGDSLTAGYGLDESQGFTRQLQAVLRDRGHDVRVINAGVSGDTAAQGLARLDWVLSEPTQAVIVELGANDALRGLPPQQTEEALRGILAELGRRKLPVLVTGMLAPPNLGKDYESRFNGIFPALARDYNTGLYPFFLEGVAGQPNLNQPDGLHPTAEGVAIIVRMMLPAVEALLQQVETRK